MSFRDGIALRIREFFGAVHLPERFAAAYAFLFMLLHPLVYDNYFFNINRFKFAVFAYGAFAALIVYLLLCLLRRRAMAGQTYEPFRLTLSDGGMALFVVGAAVSCAMSKDSYSAFTGDEGRLTGLLFVLALGAVYIVVSRSVHAQKCAVAGLAISGAVCAVVGILHFFYVDPLGFQEKLNKKDIVAFISTIGNINFFGSFLCLHIPLCAGLMFRDRWYVRAPMCLLIAAGSLAVVVSRTDAALFAPAIAIVFSFYTGVKSKRALAGACLTAASVFAGFWVSGVLIGDDSLTHMPLDGNLAAYIADGPVFMAVLAVLFSAVAFALFCEHDRQFTKKYVSLVRKIILYLLILALTAVICAFIYYTFINTDVKLTGPMRFLRFRDKWGSNRGGVWVRCLKLWNESDWRVKLLGFGPDLLKKPLGDRFGKEIAAYCNLSFNNAHNELIQYLLTQGIVGLTGHLMVFAGFILSMYKRAQSDICARAALFGAIVLFINSLVSVNQPITTPLMFAMLSASVSVFTGSGDKIERDTAEYPLEGKKLHSRRPH